MQSGICTQENWVGAAASAANLSALLQAVGKLSDALAQAGKSVELTTLEAEAAATPAASKAAFPD